MTKFHDTFFIESIPYEQVNPSHKLSTNFRKKHDIENKLTRFQIYQETEFACKFANPLYKTQYSEILVEYEQGFDMTTEKIKVIPHATAIFKNEGKPYTPVNFRKYNNHPGGKLTPIDSKSTRLQEISLMNTTYFGNIHYDIYLDIKLDYTISRIFQKRSLSELETLHQLCELERIQILQSLALAVLKLPYAGYLLSGNRSIVLDYEGNILWFYTAPKKYHPYTFLKINVVTKEYPNSTKTKYILLIHFQDEHIFGIPQSHVDQKLATTSYN